MSKIQPSQLEMYEFKRTILVAIQNGAQTRSDIAKEIGISDDLDLNQLRQQIGRLANALADLIKRKVIIGFATRSTPPRAYTYQNTRHAFKELAALYRVSAQSDTADMTVDTSSSSISVSVLPATVSISIGGSIHNINIDQATELYEKLKPIVQQ